MLAAIDAFAVAALVWVAFEDAARFRIRNSLVVFLAALYGLRILVAGSQPDLIWHCVFAFVILIVMFGVFAVGGMGAGDAKLMTVGGLWIGPDQSLPFASLLLLFTLATYLLVKIQWLPMRRVKRRTKIPFGPSIASSWIVMIVGLPHG